MPCKLERQVEPTPLPQPPAQFLVRCGSRCSLNLPCALQGEDYHTHQAPIPFTGKLQVTDEDLKKFRNESPLWAQKFPHIYTEEHLTKTGTLEAARNLVVGRDCSREYYYILFRGMEIIPTRGKQSPCDGPR